MNQPLQPCFWIGLCQSLMKSLYVLEQPSHWSKHQTSVLPLCAYEVLVTGPLDPSEGSQCWCEMGRRDFLLGSPPYTGLFRFTAPKGAPAPWAWPFRRHVQGQSRSCVLWAVNVGCGPQSKGNWSSSRNRIQWLRCELDANSQFFWTKMANIFIYYKSSGGNVSVLGVQILSLNYQILQPSPSHIYSQPLWLYVRSVTSVSHAGAMITGNF